MAEKIKRMRATDTHKKCSKCGRVKQLEDFNKRSYTKCGRKSVCKECSKVPQVISKVGYKTCKGCGIEKKVEEFNNSKNGKEGKDSRCKVCVRVYHNTVNKKTRVLKDKMEYKNIPKIIDNCIECRTCKEKKHIADYPKTRSVIGVSGVCKECTNSKRNNRHQKNIEHIREVERNWRNNYLRTDRGKAVKLKCYNKEKEQRPHTRRLRTMLWHFLRAMDRKKGTSKTVELLGYTFKEFKEKFPVIPKDYHIDHIIPISWFLPTIPVNIANSLDNLQVIPSKENLYKLNKYADVISEVYYKQVIDWIKEEYKNKIGVLNG